MVLSKYTDFLQVSPDSTEENNETNGNWIGWILRSSITLRSRCGMTGYCLISFGTSIILLLGFMMAIVFPLVIDPDFNELISKALLYLVLFIASLGIFYCHGHNANIFISARKNHRTLLISSTNPQDMNETDLRQNFRGVTKVSKIKRVDKLEELYKDLETTIETLEDLKQKQAVRPVTKKLVYRTEFYEEKKQIILKQIDDELTKVTNEMETSAYVTFETKEIAAKMYQGTSHPYVAEWAPPVQDIVWAANHKQGKWLHRFITTVVYVGQFLVPLLLSTSLSSVIRLATGDSDIFLHIFPLIFWRPLLTILPILLVKSLDLIGCR